MLIVNKHCAIFTDLYQADTWEGPEGVLYKDLGLKNRFIELRSDISGFA